MKTFVAVFTCAENSEAHEAWKKLSKDEQQQRMVEGPRLLEEWTAKYKDRILYDGGHLGEKTKLVDNSGIRDIPSKIGTLLVIQANSHEEAAKMFQGHPHFAIFPGTGVEILERTNHPRG